ncbi:ATP-dependent zinc protease family protein [Calidifontibacter terrae]
MSEQPLSSITVGWREWVALPDLGVPAIKAKVDTGARTSSLHAFDVDRFERDGALWVSFGIRPWQKSTEDIVRAQAPLLEERSVRSSSGHAEERPVIHTRLTLAGRDIEIEMTLTDRDQMGFRMLIGREALSRGFLVDSASSYAGGRPSLAVRRRNRGR